MMGKTGWVVLGCMVGFGFIGVAHAQTQTPSGGFKDLAGFVLALETMSAEKFSRLAEETPISAIREYHQVLSGFPARFTKWNEKLRLIPCMGYVRYSDCWLLFEKGPEMTIGFKPEAKPGAFQSVVDFYESALQDEPAVFQARAGQTPEELLDGWLGALEKQNPELYQQVLLKFQVMRTVGYKPEKPFRLIEPQAPKPTPVGFVTRQLASEPVRVATPFRSSGEIILALDTLSPEELRARLLQTSEAQRKRLLDALKKRDPATYQRLVERVRSRTRIGFSTASEPEIIVPPKKGEAIAPVGFRVGESGCAELLTPEAD
ncbi:hypothetical protein EB061_04090 [bacterium]|jgi:hypothetical protein|nr:hypothetical protein [bacterium]